MGKTIDFFATQLELSHMWGQWCRSLDLFCAVIAFSQRDEMVKLGKESYTCADDLHRFVFGGAYDEIWFSTLEINHVGKSIDDFRTSNSGLITSNLAIETSSFVSETSMGIVSAEVTNLNVAWRKILGSVRTQTSQGMWLVDRVAKRDYYYKNSRFTPEIANLSKRGVSLKSFEGFEMRVEPLFANCG